MTQTAASKADRVLDVGATAESVGASNPLLSWYPWPENLTACGLEETPSICSDRSIRYVQADGCDLPFDDRSFDIAHSNAVIEHVGSRDRQRRFVRELCRVGRRVFIATPDGDSPIEVHTLLPCVHWLPLPLRRFVCNLLGRGYYANEDHLNPLGAGELRSLFPGELRTAVNIQRQYLMGLPAVLIATLILPEE